MVDMPLAASMAAPLVGAGPASIRRRMSNGSMTDPYSCCLKVPRSLSATFHTKATLSSNPTGDIPDPLAHVCRRSARAAGRPCTLSAAATDRLVIVRFAVVEVEHRDTVGRGVVRTMVLSADHAVGDVGQRSTPLG